VADLSYEMIKTLIVEETVSGDSLLFVFQCPLSGSQIPAQHDFPKPSGAGAGAKKTMMRSLLTFAQTGIKVAGKALFGKNKMGKMATNIAKSSVKSAGKDLVKARIFSVKEKRYGAVESFRSVQGQWLWDGFRSTWLVRAEAGRFISELQQQVATAGLVERYDREVAARIMVEVARSEDSISPAEEDFLIRFLGAEHHTVSDILTRPPLTDAELEQTEPGESRVTVLMMAWVMALSDGLLSTQKNQALSIFGERLGVGQDGVQQAAETARRYIVEEVMRGLYADGDAYNDATRAKAYAFAGQIGMDQDGAELTEARFLKRLSYGA
jgi:hypothetical protein